MQRARHAQDEFRHRRFEALPVFSDAEILPAHRADGRRNHRPTRIFELLARLEQEVKGLGVVGHQPLLKPGEQFEYTSWAVIATPVGTMRGEYFCVAEDGERFEAPVPEFVLRMPRTLH